MYNNNQVKTINKSSHFIDITLYLLVTNLPTTNDKLKQQVTVHEKLSLNQSKLSIMSECECE